MRCEGYMLVTRDIETAKNFYCDVIGARIELDIGTHVVFREGFSLLIERDWSAFSGLDCADFAYRHHTGQLVFEVDDIQAFLQRLSGLSALPGPQYVHQVKEHPWGRWAVRLYDPDGHVVEVGESMKVVVKRFLSQGLTEEEAARRSEFPVEYARMCKKEMEDGGG